MQMGLDSSVIALTRIAAGIEFPARTLNRRITRGSLDQTGRLRPTFHVKQPKPHASGTEQRGVVMQRKYQAPIFWSGFVAIVVLLANFFYQTVSFLAAIIK